MFDMILYDSRIVFALQEIPLPIIEMQHRKLKLWSGGNGNSSDTYTNQRSGWINRNCVGDSSAIEISHVLEVFEPLETQFIKAVSAPCQTRFQIIAGLSTWIYVLLRRSKVLLIVYILYICIDIHCVYILKYYLYIIWHIDILKCYAKFSHSEPPVIPQYTIHRFSNWSSSPQCN